MRPTDGLERTAASADVLARPEGRRKASRGEGRSQASCSCAEGDSANFRNGGKADLASSRHMQRQHAPRTPSVPVGCRIPQA